MHVIFVEELYDETVLTTRLADYGNFILYSCSFVLNGGANSGAIGLGSVMAMALVNKLILQGYVERGRRTRHSQSQGTKLHTPATTKGRKPKDQLLRLFDPLLYIAEFVSIVFWPPVVVELMQYSTTRTLLQM